MLHSQVAVLLSRRLNRNEEMDADTSSKPGKSPTYFFAAELIPDFGFRGHIYTSTRKYSRSLDLCIESADNQLPEFGIFLVQVK